MTKYISYIIYSFALLFISVSCTSTKNIAYLQEIEGQLALQNLKPQPITLQRGDKVSIVVKSGSTTIDSLLNFSSGRPILTTSGLSQDETVLGYTLNSSGVIDLPMLGQINSLGLTREELSANIKKGLSEKFPTIEFAVNVDFINLKVSVLGEVAKPGRYSIDKDSYTILDLLGDAHDLTIYGKRENVKVMRDEDGKQVIYSIDLSSKPSLYSSPAYFLKQNDVVYVEPNKVRARESTLNGNNVRKSSFWVSIISLITTTTLLIVL